MKINIEKEGKLFRADFVELPGSPSIGNGETEAFAVATLFIRNLENLKRLNLDYLEINGKPYQQNYDR